MPLRRPTCRAVPLGGPTCRADLSGPPSLPNENRLNPAIGQSWVIYLRVDDIEALHARLERGGFPVSEIEVSSYGTREFFVADPDGYELWISVPQAQDDAIDEGGEAGD